MKETQLSGQTPDLARENFDKLKALFPDIVSDGKIDGEKLKQLVGEYLDEAPERYNFSWNGKGQALRLAQTPSTGTLRPCVAESKNWDSTGNLYLEGDNLEVLKLLQKSYHSRVKMIYIDPPYNTGKDFVYPDNFKDSLENYKALTGQTDEAGRNLSSNSETSGRYHTDWLNMIYPRLRLARNLLTDDGVIFISIDDNEVGNLRKVCDEIFGETNFLGNLIWEKKYTVANDAKYFSDNHDHILCYGKNVVNLIIGRLPRTDSMNAAYKNPDNHIKGLWKATPLHAKSGSAESAQFTYTFKNGVVFRPPTGTFSRYSSETLKRLDEHDEIWFGQDGKAIPSRKTFLSELKNEGVVPRTIITYTDGGHNHEAVDELKNLLEMNVFTNPKPTKLIKRLATIANTNQDSIILDFFSGSATTADAVMQLNAEDGGNRKFIMVQLPEPTDESSEAAKAGYHNICEIGKERIRRAGEKIMAEKGLLAHNLDVGFKVFKLDSSNIRKWQPRADNLEQSLLDQIENLVPDRSDADAVYEIMLKYGLDLTWPVEELSIATKKVYSIGLGALIICMDNEITTAIAQGILDHLKAIKPETTRVVFRDNGFKTDSNKTNIKEMLKCGGIEEFITI